MQRWFLTLKAYPAPKGIDNFVTLSVQLHRQLYSQEAFRLQIYMLSYMLSMVESKLCPDGNSTSNITKHIPSSL